MKSFVLLLTCLSASFFAIGQQFGNRYELVKMDKNVNTFHHEAAPVVSPDGNTLYFFVQDHPENSQGSDDTQDIWVSKKDANGVWSKAEHLRNPFNIHNSNQVFTVFEDGSLFIRGGRTKGEKGFSLVTNGSLKEISVKDFKAMNKGRFYGASMSDDKKHIILYFSEKEGSEASDLYASHLQPDGSYSRPEKMKLSTTTDEVGPFIGPDQKVLYFGSARQAPGRQGGVDIYKATRLDDTWMNWSEPVNMGKPINTGALDFYFTVDRAGNVFTSRANKALEGAQLDLYALVPKTFSITVIGTVLNGKNNNPLQADIALKIKEKEPMKMRASIDGAFKTTRLPEMSEFSVSTSLAGFQPNEQTIKVPRINSDTTIIVDVLLIPIAKKLLVTGNVYNKKTDQQMPAKVEVTLKSDRKTNFKLDAANGTYQREVPKLGWYMLTASADGFLNATDSVELPSDDLSPAVRDLYLTPIEVGLTVRLNNIYFDFDKTTLKPASYPELNKVVNFLKKNSTVEIEISGHTDNKGTDEYNLNLSQGRCQAVVDYLVSQGIENFRLTPQGYGEGQPIDTNDTDAGRANNRRVEVKVLKK
jgi:outer membrane protein OmpA-like peptidoglycan-associated protein